MFFQTTLLWIISENCVNSKGMDMKTKRDKSNAIRL